MNENEYNMKWVTMFFIYLMVGLNYLCSQQTNANLNKGEFEFDTLYVDPQQNFEEDRVVLFINGVQVFDKADLKSNTTQGRVLGGRFYVPFTEDSLHITYYYFEKNHEWSLGEDVVYRDSKKLKFTIVPEDEGCFLGLGVIWDLDRGSYTDEKLSRAVNLFPEYTVSKQPFKYY